MEPWIAAVRAFVEDYDPSVAQKLEEAAALKASAEPTFWRLNFEAAAPQRFARFLDEVSRQRKCSEQNVAGGDAIPESLRPLADEVYTEWLAATAQPIKGEVRAALASCGLLITKEEAATRGPGPGWGIVPKSLSLTVLRRNLRGLTGGGGGQRTLEGAPQASTERSPSLPCESAGFPPGAPRPEQQGKRRGALSPSASATSAAKVGVATGVEGAPSSAPKRLVCHEEDRQKQKQAMSEGAPQGPPGGFLSRDASEVFTAKGEQRMEETEEGAQERLNGPSGLRVLGLACPPNAVLQDALYSILVQGIPVPTASVSTFCLTLDSETSFVHRLFIGEADDILYKVEASGDWPVGVGPRGGPPTSSLQGAEGGPPSASLKGPPHPAGAAAAHDAAAPLSCCSCRAETRGPFALSCIERGSKPLQRVQPTQLLIYVSYPYCRDVWHAGASELFAHYIAGKPLAPCSVSLLNRTLHQFDLLVEVENVSRDTAIRRELALQLSRMRQRLQCGPIQHFLRSLGKRRPGVFREVQVRRDERIWFSVSAGVVHFVHRFVCADLIRWTLTLKYCQEIAAAATSGPRRLPEASASSESPAALSHEVEKARFPPDELAVYLVLGFPAAGFSPEFSATTRSLRALTLAEMIVSLQPHIAGVVREELLAFRRLWKPNEPVIPCEALGVQAAASGV
ncbi:hypothetical protein Esti_000206 [Eimeria stiedai]